MPSPFPGMDPFIESQRWDDFHATFVPALAELLVPQLRPRYTVDIERYVFLLDETDEHAEHYAPDVSIVDRGGLTEGESSGAIATVEPHVLTLPLPADVQQKYLVIRSRERGELVGLIEVLSPWNKKAGKGQMEYLQKRANYLRSDTHIIEFDLLRGGTRLPMIEPLPAGDYFAFIGRSGRRPKVDVYAWRLPDRLPTIPIPLKEGDADASLDLQEAFTHTYDRGGYDYALDYEQPPLPPLSDADQKWAAELLADVPTDHGPRTTDH